MQLMALVSMLGGQSVMRFAVLLASIFRLGRAKHRLCQLPKQPLIAGGVLLACHDHVTA